MASVDRRDFLKAGLAAAATGVLARTGTGAGASETLHFALIGAGAQGSHVAGNLLKVPSTRLTALCEIFAPNVEAWKKKARQAEFKDKVREDLPVYEDWNELLAQEKDLQAVIIALPEHTHRDAAVAALRAGKHVFCEKPMAYTLDEGRDMLAAAKAADRVLQIGQQRRSSPLYYYAYDLLQKKGLIGEILRVDAFWDRSADWKRKVPKVDKDFSKWGFPTTNHLVNWRLFRQYSHGLMTENGTHQMDASGWLLGNKKPVTVCGMGATRYRDGRGTHDIASAEYRYEGDVIVRFTQDFHQGFNYGWEYGELFLGREGALRVTEERHIVHTSAKDKTKTGKKLNVAELADIEFPGVRYTADDLGKVTDYRKFSYENEMKIFDHCVRTGAQPTCTAEIGFNSIVPTIQGTVAQFDRKYIDFDASIWV
jgi:predicted dehydrogenase